MSRIDVQTLVLAFENRITALNKNPPDLVPQKTISLMLENALEQEIKNNIAHVLRQDIHNAFKKEFKKMKVKIVHQVMKDILSDSHFKQTLSDRIKSLIIGNIK
jgi:AAA+ superfamily predicted ATPase